MWRAVNYRIDFAQVTGMRGNVLSQQTRIRPVGLFSGGRLQKFVELQWRQSAYFLMAIIFEENVVDLPSGSFAAHIASLRTDIAFNSRWSWSNLLQYSNTADRIGINSRVRYIPEAGKEVILVLNHGADIDIENRPHGAITELVLKASYTFRY